MDATRRIAISYSRFSDHKQAHGDSEDRQERMFRDFSTRHNLTPLLEVFADRGRSGYHDEHRKKGRLGQLIAMARDGRFEPGTVIVVEAWDRLGRLRPDRQTELIAELLRTGVRIGVCRLDDIFSEEDFGTHKWTTLAVFIQLAYQESKQKAERVAESWQKRRTRAREEGKLVGCPLPAWLEMANGEARLIPAHVATIKRIFALAIQGHGQTKIVGMLHEEGRAPFGEAVVNEGRKRSQFSGKWTRPYVRLILNDRRVLGEMQLMKGDKPDGPPLAGFYPACVTEEEFLLAQEAQSARKNCGERATSERKYVNAFRSLLRHARDGEGFLLHNKGTAAAPELLLVSAKGNGGIGSTWTFPYGIFETVVLGLLREVDRRDVLPREAGPSRVDVLRASLKNVRADIAGLKEELKAGFSKGIAAVLREAETREEEVAGQLQAELAKTLQPAEKAWDELPGLVEMIAGSPEPENVRLRIWNVLRRMVDCVNVLIVRRGCHSLAALQVAFAGSDKRRSYLILYRAGNRWHKTAWWARSLASAEGLDLRQPAHVEEVERQLMALDLASLAGN